MNEFEPLELTVGSRWRSVSDETQVVVVKAPPTALDLRCGGHSMVPHDAEVGSLAEPIGASGEGTLIGKRYEAEGLELLCTAAGDGSLTIGDQPMEVKGAKPLPSSD